MSHRTGRIRMFGAGAGFAVWVVGMVLCSLVIASQAADAATDRIYFTINGDSSLTTLTQGDTLQWAANCDTGTAIHWDIWYDADEDSTIDPDTDVLIESYNVIDGDVFDNFECFIGDVWQNYFYVSTSDNNYAPDGWYHSPAVAFPPSPGLYIFRVVGLIDSSAVERTLTIVPPISPTRTTFGRVVLDGYPAPNSEVLSNIVVFGRSFAGSEHPQPWIEHITYTDSNGQYKIQEDGSGPSYLVMRPPHLSGFIHAGSYGAAVDLDSGVAYLPDIVLIRPTDSVYGQVIDDYGVVITRPNWIYYSSWDRRVRSIGGHYAFYIDWTIGPNGTIHGPILTSANLAPDYMTPLLVDLTYAGHGTRHDFVCPRADTTITFIVTERGEPPSQQYLIIFASDSLAAYSAALSGLGHSNRATLHVSSRRDVDWGVGFGRTYPLLESTYPYMTPPTPQPGDTVLLDFRDLHVLTGKATLDPADSSGGENWGPLTVYVTNPLGSTGTSVDGDAESFAVKSPIGLSRITVLSDDYLVSPYRQEVSVVGDSTDQFEITVNRRSWNVTGRLVNFPVSMLGRWTKVKARTGASLEGYYAEEFVNGSNGAYFLNLCDGEWTIEPPEIEGYIAPPPQHLTIGHDTGTTVLDLVYTVVTDVDEPETDESLPTGFTLKQNYPNPFNPSTTIEFELPTASLVNLTVFNILGRKVHTLVSETRTAGQHSVEWNGTDESGKPVASGVYFYRLKTAKTALVKKMLLLK